MTRQLQKIGNSKGLVMTRDMLDHLGVQDAVEVSMEQGRIIITPPVDPTPRRRMSFQEAKKATFEQYDETLRRLADAD